MSVSFARPLVHLIASPRRTACKLPKTQVRFHTVAGMWPVLKADHRCPICEREYQLACTLAELTGPTAAPR